MRRSMLSALMLLACSSFALAQRTPDLSGIWSFNGLRTLSNQTPPMTAAGQRKFNANKPSYGPRAIPPALGNDPAGKCEHDRRDERERQKDEKEATTEPNSLHRHLLRAGHDSGFVRKLTGGMERHPR